MRIILTSLAALALGCSAIGQVSTGGAVGAVDKNVWGGGGVTGHLGLGGRVQAEHSKLAWTNALMPVGVDIMARVYGTTQYASFAYGEGYYLSSDFGKHTGIARFLGLIECNTGAVLLCGGGVRGEAVFGIYFTRRTELPMFGLEIGYAFEDDLVDISRGALLR